MMHVAGGGAMSHAAGPAGRGNMYGAAAFSMQRRLLAPVVGVAHALGLAIGLLPESVAASAMQNTKLRAAMTHVPKAKPKAAIAARDPQPGSQRRVLCLHLDTVFEFVCLYVRFVTFSSTS